MQSYFTKTIKWSFYNCIQVTKGNVGSILASLVFALMICYQVWLFKSYNGKIKLSPVPVASIQEMMNLYKGDLFVPSSKRKKDWHNYTQIEYEKNRDGLGEHGKPAEISAEDEYLINKLYVLTGYNAALGDKIALNRSLPDFRHEICKRRLYLESLPKASIVMPFFNEHWTTLLRSVISVVNRTPKELLKEFFLVDDGSTDKGLKFKLDSYLRNNWLQVKVIRLPKRNGLVAARLAGALQSTGDVIVFLDSHVEANVNWLPPLLEPIALDYKTVMIPLIDVIDHETFEYRLMDLGKRGVFNWKLNYMRISLTPKNSDKIPEPFETPVMMGLFAISRHFFWELGGYDPGITYWGGEQYEISFKIWMCGGRMLEAPCSRVGHIFREFLPASFDPLADNHLAKNYRRVADVWMDEYATYLYSRFPHWKYIDPGNLTEQKMIRQKLKCKPFKWFVTQIAFDLLQQYPLEDPLPYAAGSIRPRINPEMCVDGLKGTERDLALLQPCYPPGHNLAAEENEQSFDLTWFNDIKLNSRYMCLNPLARNPKPGSRVGLITCHRDGGNQQWRYDFSTKQLIHFTNCCMDHEPENVDLFLNLCDVTSETQRWEIDVVNKKQLAKWNETHTVRVTGPIEEWKE